MTWTVEIGDEFEPEFNGLHEDVRTEILALSRLLQQFGAAVGKAPRGHAQWFPLREHEGAAL